jgi:valyl-tRNA synthetase
MDKTKGKLNSEGFIIKAPPEVVTTEKARFEEQKIRMAKLEQRLQELK